MASTVRATMVRPNWDSPLLHFILVEGMQVVASLEDPVKAAVGITFNLQTLEKALQPRT